jgi:outer membrane protein OmpA-like peptidoglycan-associated protein
VKVHPWNGGQGIELYIVEEKAMEQYVVADADALAKEISLTGKVAVYGIDSARMKAHGVGPLAPVSTNRSEEGRTANRRVELVEQ